MRSVQSGLTEALLTDPGRDLYRKSFKSEVLKYQERFRSTDDTLFRKPGGDACGARAAEGLPGGGGEHAPGARTGPEIWFTGEGYLSTAKPFLVLQNVGFEAFPVQNLVWISVKRLC